MNFDIDTKIDGLSDLEVKKRLLKDGYNEIVVEKPKTILNFIVEVVQEPMILLLFVSAGIYLLLGDPREAGILLISVIGVILITIYQQQKTEKSIQALKNLASPTAKVIRDGQELEIPAREVVKGDVIVFAEGDKIPSDAKILSCSNLTVDESILTGESVAVTKTQMYVGDAALIRPGGDNLPVVYCGTLVTKGHGMAEVVATGLQTQMGKIGESLQSLSIEKTLLQKEVTKVVKIMAMIGLFFCVVLIIVYGLARHDWLNAFLAGITLAIGTLPEEFPIVLTLFLSMGAWRLAQNKVLARRAAAIETLGSTSILCVDKTGTLTQNKMTIAKVFIADKYYGIEEFHDKNLKEIFKVGVLASQENPFDDMEKAFLVAGEQYLTNDLSDDPQIEFALSREYPLEKDSLSVIHAHRQKDGEVFIAAKGSPESIIQLCHLSEAKANELNSRAIEMAKMGLRVIAVAKSTFSGDDLPSERHDFNFVFLGFVGLSDPLKEGVVGAIKMCNEAGIKVMMITGDFSETAKSIASQIGLKNIDNVITGDELEKLSESELIDKIKEMSIFSRVIPEQKLKIVNALKKSGEIVAMTGDGVNDAPALKSAHVGVAMGQQGTDVAREAAAIVLLDDNFVSIVNGIKLGRRIYDNLKKAMTYLFAVHVPIIGLSLLPVFFGWPLILFPIHIVFLELIIDPVCTIVFEGEKEDSDIMQRMPRRLDQPIFSSRIITMSVIQGLVALAVIIFSYKIAQWLLLDENQTRTFVFSTLVFSNLFLVVVNRSWRRGFFKTVMSTNLPFILVSVFTSLILLLAIYLPVLSNLFKFSPLSYLEVFYALSLGLLSVIWFEIYKYFSIKNNAQN